jgi:hypothetical protein
MPSLSTMTQMDSRHRKAVCPLAFDYTGVREKSKKNFLGRILD